MKNSMEIQGVWQNLERGEGLVKKSEKFLQTVHFLLRCCFCLSLLKTEEIIGRLCHSKIFLHQITQLFRPHAAYFRGGELHYGDDVKKKLLLQKLYPSLTFVTIKITYIREKVGLLNYDSNILWYTMQPFQEVT